MIAFAMLFVSCSNELQEEQSTPKTYTVSLGVKGEILDVIQTPLTKSGENNNLYGIQVYSSEKPSDEDIAYNKYAYGLFDDITKAEITLIGGYSYEFVCTMIINGKNLITKSDDNYYAAPFGNTLTNTFTITTQASLSGLHEGYSVLSNGKGYNYPNVDRYYGRIKNYTPIDNTPICIDMERTVFGVKFVAEGLTEGKLKIVMENAPELYINSTDSNHEIEDIFTCYRPIDAAICNDYSSSTKISIYWQKEDGSETPIVMSHSLSFTRKMMHTVRINLAGTSTKGGTPISITLEDGVLGTGKDYTIGEAQN